MAKKLAKDIQDLLKSKPIKEFIKSAEHFIFLVENPRIKGKSFYRKSYIALADLYAKAVNLPEIKYLHHDENVEDYEFKDDIKYINRLKTKLGKDIYYPHYHDVIKPYKDEPTNSWLFDDFHDIYHDIKEEIWVIKNIKNNGNIELALFYLQDMFTYHWGVHCIGALRALHSLKYDHEYF